MASSSSSSSSCQYDVFLSFRGEDTRKKFVDHLYSALQLRGIYTYKDDEKLPGGEVIGPSLFKAIRESKIVVIVFSKNYADSSWCLDELAYVMKYKDIIMPIFYDVDPSDVRKQKGEFGKAFEKQKLENITKVESWRKALVDAGNLSGWEPKHIANGHEAKCIKEIVDTISNKLFSLNSNFDEDDLVGMDTRVSHLISQLKLSSDGVRMVGIWGVGGGGKTTLASSVHMKISRDFEADCIVDDVREESGKHGIKKLQENILSTILKTTMKVHSVEDGKRKIKERLCHKKVLILLDDVDDRKQLEALAGSHEWFGEGSRIIITTRNEHLLISHRVVEVSRISLLSDAEALRLFNRYAYQENNLVEGYGTLSERVVSYAAGLPLALKVLGSFLYDKDINEWLSTLARLEDNPEMEIVETLKISYDGLTRLEQELFLDIACFFRGSIKDYAMQRLNACGFHPDIGITVLIQKALITITGTDGGSPRFDMHDLVQEMGHYIVRGEHPNNPEKHSRVWKTIEIDNMCSVNAIMQENYKIEAIKYEGKSSRFPRFVSNMMKLRLLDVRSTDIGDMMKLRLLDVRSRYTSTEEPILHSSELRCVFWNGYPESSFPESFQPTKLVYLQLRKSLQIELWKGYKILPCLKKLVLIQAHMLVTTPDFSGLPCLEMLVLFYCRRLERIHPSLGHHRSLVYVNVGYSPKLGMFPAIVRMEKLQHLTMTCCDMLRVFPAIETNMDSLVELDLSRNDFKRLDFSLSQLTRLKFLNVKNCERLVELPELPSSISVLLADGCVSLEAIGYIHTNCKWLCHVSLLNGRTVIGVDKLLQSMLEGKAIENHFMVLRDEGLEIVQSFTPPLRKGTRYTLELPENWCNDFCGFLICGTMKIYGLGSIHITMTYAKGMNSELELSSNNLADIATETWVVYISFGLLRHTTWWDETSNVISFSNAGSSALGVRLIPRKTQSVRMETTTDSPQFYCRKDGFAPRFCIIHDSKFALKCVVRGYQ